MQKHAFNRALVLGHDATDGDKPPLPKVRRPRGGRRPKSWGFGGFFFHLPHGPAGRPASTHPYTPPSSLPHLVLRSLANCNKQSSIAWRLLLSALFHLSLFDVSEEEQLQRNHQLPHPLLVADFHAVAVAAAALAIAGMGLAGGLLGFGLGLAIGLAAAYLVYFRFFAPRRLQDPVIRPLRDLDSETLKTIIPDIPLWVKSPDYERVDWMNKFIFDIWPFMDKAICNTIRSATKPIFDQYIGQYGIESIEFGHLTLGALPPTFQGVKVYEMQEKELVIEPVIRWASMANVIVNAKVHSLNVSAQLLDLHIMLTPRVTLKPLVPSFPCFANLRVSLMEKPHVDFGFKLLGGDVMAIPGLYQFAQEQISKQISILYHWPKVLQIPILDGASGATKKPVGILHVKVIRAMNLLKMDLLGKSDPYVKLRLSGERLPSKKTSVKMSNLNPEWNEHFRLIVKDPATQVLELHMFDWEKVKMHDKLGMQVIPLSLLTPYESKLFTLDLLRSMNPNDPHNKKNRGKLVVELTFDPFRDDNSRIGVISDGEGNVSVRKDLSSTGGLLLVSVENAGDVEGKHHTNPYAVVIFRGERKETKVIRKTRDPRWNEEFQFMVEEAPVDDKIHIEVRSKRRGLPFHNKESLGHVDINLVDVVNNGRINEKYHLINSRNGTIHVEIKWSTV